MNELEKKSSSVIGSHVLGGELAGAASCLFKQVAADIRKCRQALGKAAKAKDDEGDPSAFEALAATFDQGATNFAELADRYMTCAQALATKAAGGAAPESPDDDPPELRERVLKLVSQALGDRIAPDNIHGAISYRAVPRVGMRELPSDGSAGMDPQLAKIIGVSE